MAPSLDRSNVSFNNIGALSQLVEAASALTELQVKEQPAKKAQSTALVSDDDETSRTTAKASDKTVCPPNPRKKEIFPQKLMEILADSSTSEIISWLPHGRSFVIIRPDLFCEEVLPKYLPPADSRGSTKYPSFTRKLNRWGFRQATRGADTGAFHHPFFRRDQPELCAKMVCQKSRDRQQGTQKQRSLPPKKRVIPENAPPKFSGSNQVLPSILTSTESVPIANSNYQLAQMAAPISADERTISSCSTVSQTSTFGRSMALSNNNKFVASASIHSAIAPTAGTVSVTTGSSQPLKASENSGAAGVMPFISNDAKFVANTLKRRESLEIYRAAKAMLYDAYMKAVNEEPR